MEYSLSDFTRIFSFFVIFLLSLKLRSSYTKGNKSNPMVRDFFLSFLYLSLFMLMIGWTGFTISFIDNKETYMTLYKYSYFVGQVFLALSTAYTCRIPFHIYFTKFKKYVLPTFLLLGSLIIYSLFRGPFNPVREGQIIESNIPIFAAIVMGIASLISWGIPTISFSYFAIKSNTDKQKRSRALLLAIGFFIVTISGPLHVAADRIILSALIDLLSLIGLSFLVYAIAFLKIDTN